MALQGVLPHAEPLPPRHRDTERGPLSWDAPLNSTYAHLFNERHGVDGHLFQARFHSVLIETSSHLLELARYVVLNPVRARLCSHPAEWPWSSYRAMVGFGAPEPLLSANWLVTQFGSTAEKAGASFLAFVRYAAAAAPAATA